MKKSVIQELYNGKIFPCEQIKAATPISRELGKKIDHLNKKISETMSGNTEIVEKLGNLYFELMENEVEAAFSHGLKLGLQLMSEATCDASDDIDDE